MGNLQITKVPGQNRVDLRWRVRTLSEIRLPLARVPWRSIAFVYFHHGSLYFLKYVPIDVAGLEGLVIYRYVLLTESRLYLCPSDYHQPTGKVNSPEGMPWIG